METKQFNQSEFSAPQNEGLQINTRENQSVYDNKNLEEPNAAEAGQGSEAAGNMLAGALWCIGGIVVTAVTYSAAGEGGTFIIAWGAILFGAIQFLKGVGQLFE